MELTQEFINHLALLLGLMFGFTTLRVAMCKPFDQKGEKFKWKRLFYGLLKQLIAILGTLVVYYVGVYCGSDLLLIQIGDTKLTIQGAVDVTILAVVAVYGAKYIKNLAEFMGIATESHSYSSSYGSHHKGKLLGYLYSAEEKETSIEECYTNSIQPVSIEEIAAQTTFNTDSSVSEDCEVG